jgi:hypothetical protein
MIQGEARMTSLINNARRGLGAKKPGPNAEGEQEPAVPGSPPKSQSGEVPTFSGGSPVPLSPKEIITDSKKLALALAHK